MISDPSRQALSALGIYNANSKLPPRQTPDESGGLQLQYPKLRRQANVRGFSCSPKQAVTSVMERHWHTGDSVTVLSRLLLVVRVDLCRSLPWKGRKYCWRRGLFVRDMQLQHRDRVSFVFGHLWEFEERQSKSYYRCPLSKLAMC